MNTVQLECFLSVAENLNFARAAEALHITQPAVTHQINSLETELNAKLFHRTTRTVELTTEGWNFIGDARNILMLTHAAKTRAANRSDNEIVPFTIGCHSSIELSFLPDLIRELVKIRPQSPSHNKSCPSSDPAQSSGGWSCGCHAGIQGERKPAENRHLSGAVQKSFCLCRTKLPCSCQP